MSRGAQSRSAGIPDEPGPVGDDEDVHCADCPLTNPEDAVFRVPDPRYSIATVTALCEYHLAALKREYPLRWRKIRDHPRIDGLEAAAKDHALVERDDVPDEISIDGEVYQRLGLDQLGRAYFVAETGWGWRVVETDERFDVQESTKVERGRLRGLLDHVDEQVGWRGLEGEWIDRAQAEVNGGEDSAE